jgi:anti-sigma B factor antagonist
MLEPFSIQVSLREPSNQIAVVTVGGHIDSITSSEVEKTLEGLLDRKVFKIVVDLEHVTYISSAGWGIFLGILKEIRTSQGNLRLSGLSKEVMEVVKLLEIDRFIPTYRSLSDAVTSF